jgi:hypothetical protein
MAPTYAVLFRCHFWDDFCTRQLERLKQRCETGDVFVVVDETQGPVSAITHSEDRILRVTGAAAEALGLAHIGDAAAFWYNADYPLHLFTRRYPDYRYYLMIEFDAVVNVGLDGLIARLDADGVDFVGEPIPVPTLTWPWLYTCEGWYAPEDIRKWLTCISVFSHRAAPTLFQRRVRASARVRAGEATVMPFCEAAVGTELHLAGFRLTPLHELGSTRCYGTFPPRPEEDLPLLAEESFLHPILDRRRFAAKLMSETTDIPALLNEDNPTRGSLGNAAMAWALPLIHHHLYRIGDDAGCRRALDQLRLYADSDWLRFLGLDASNIAFGKPAAQSSRSDWSLRPHDAAGAVVGPPSGAFSFHTLLEERPWWAVDLLSPHSVSRVLVFNRLEIPNRANGLELYVSIDGRHWYLAGRHEGTPFGGWDGRPLDIAVDRMIRFVRLELPHRGILHLDQVQVIRSAAPD